MSEDALVSLKAILDKVAGLKIPSKIRTGELVDGGDAVPLTAREKISQLESYLLLTAEGRQLALVSRLAANDELFEIRQRIAAEDGWQMYMEGSRAKWTAPQVDAARRRALPEDMARKDRLEWLVKEFDLQVRRLEADDAVASRAYTMIVGS